MPEFIDSLRAEKGDMFIDANKYAPKLNFTERCEVLAAQRAGIKKPIIATAYRINISTLNFICQPSSRHYRAVRKEYADLGHEAFIERYFTASVRERLEVSAKDPASRLSASRYDAARELPGTPTADRRAKKYEGKHTVYTPGGALYVDVQFHEELPASDAYPDPRDRGWYVTIDPNSPGYDPAFGNEPQGFFEHSLTSYKALEAFMGAIGGSLA